MIGGDTRSTIVRCDDTGCGATVVFTCTPRPRFVVNIALIVSYLRDKERR